MITAIDLFAGPGGWDLAAKALGLDPLGIEWDDAAVATREAAGLVTEQADVSKLDPLEVARVAFDTGVGFDWSPDLLIASPPCPTFSSAGKGDGIADLSLVYQLADAIAADPSTDVHTAMPDELWRDTRSRLVIEPLRWALQLEPRFLAWEQVPPVLPFWEYCAEILRRKGWNVWTGVIEAERYGVPQTRERAILMADREGAVHPPRPTHQRYIKGEPQRHEMTMEGEVLPWVSMAEALGWVDGTLYTGQRSTISRTKEDNTIPYTRETSEPAPVVMANSDRWKFRNGNQEKAVDWAYDRRQQQGAPDNRVPVPLVPASEPAPTLSAQGLAKGRDVWTRERPAPTIVTTRRSSDGILVGRQLPEGEGKNIGGHNWPNERPATTVAGDPRISKPGRHDPEESGSQQKDAIRVTLEEAAILQSFRPDYPFQGTNSQRFLQVGNAMPPLLAHAILSALLAPVLEPGLELADVT